MDQQKARSTFGTSAEEAEATKELAFNQGFYNLFLAIAAILGIIFIATGMTVAGTTLVLVGTLSMAAASLVLSMAAASLVLLLSSPDKAGAALKQGIVPALGAIAIIMGAVI